MPRILESVDKVATKDEIKLLACQLVLLVAVTLVGLQVLKTLGVELDRGGTNNIHSILSTNLLSFFGQHHVDKTL